MVLIIGDSQLIVENGKFQLKDKNGKINDIKIEILSINVDNIIQTINNRNTIYDIIIDDYLDNLNNNLFEKGSDHNTIKFNKDGTYLLNYNINMELLNNHKTMTHSFFRIKEINNNFEILNKTKSYGYFDKFNKLNSLNTSYLSYMNKNTEIKLSIEIINGKGFFKTIPNEININILKID